ncbi:MAG: N-6 DNA methylase, partial [Bacteroidales bacterium]
MLDIETRRRIDAARDILVGKVPDPKSQVEQITIALIYKFMDDMDSESEEMGGERKYFIGEYSRYAWHKLMDRSLGGYDVLNLYSESILKMNQNPNVPQLFRDIFKNAYLPYRDPETLKAFLKTINDFTYDHSEKLGDAFEYLLSVLGSQGDAGQFRTPRHIIDFMVAIIEPQKHESILDPACGTAGFLISSYKHILKNNSSNYDPENDPAAFEMHGIRLEELGAVNGKKYKGDKLTPDERTRLMNNIRGYDISPDMVRLSLVNLYLHGFTDPHIFEYDTLTSEERWNEYSDVILANPPFMSPKGGIRPHKRFSVTSSRSEVLFVDYMAEHLTPTGKAAIIVPEGIIFQSGTAYKTLRKMLVEENYLVGVISLPAGVFNPYSGVKTSILWLDRTLAKKTDKILFVKINNDGFDLGAQRRPIKQNDMPEAFRNIVRYKESMLKGEPFDADQFPGFTVAEKTKVAVNGDYNLSGERYLIVERKGLQTWPMIELGSVIDFLRGVTYSKKNESEEEDSKIVLRANNIEISSGKIIFSDLKRVSSKLVFKDSQKLLKGDILICTASGSAEHIGKVGYSFEDTSYYFGGFMGVIRSKGAIDAKYLFFQLKNEKFRKFLVETTVGANIRNLNFSNFSVFRIPLPPLSFQHEIVGEIEGYQKIIDGARQVVENWKPRIDVDPEWPVVELGEVCQLTYGYTDTARDEGDARFIRITDIDENGELRNNDIKYINL